MPGIREQKKRDTADRLGKVTTSIAAKRGISAVSPAEICTIVGVSARTFHNYFATREEAIEHHIRKVMAYWPIAISKAPQEWDSIQVLMQTTKDNIENGGEDDFTYVDALILSGLLSNLGNMRPQDLVLDGIRDAALALSEREGFSEIQDEHLVMAHWAWHAVYGAVLGAHGADDPENAFMPLFHAALKTVETVLREGLFKLPEGV